MIRSDTWSSKQTNTITISYDYYGLCLSWTLWDLVSCIIRRNFALSVLGLPTGIGRPDPLKLIRPPDEGVASLLSLIFVSVCWALSLGLSRPLPLLPRDKRVGILSRVREVEPRTSSTKKKKEESAGNRIYRWSLSTTKTTCM